MVGVLIRMKLAVLRRASTGSRANWAVTGRLLGVLAALGTCGMATLQTTSPSTVLDLLAVVLAIWTLGWMAGPAWVGEPVLRAEHFALVPVPRGKLAAGLLGAAFVGTTTAVTLVAFASTIVFAVRLGGVLPVVVAVLTTLVELTVVVLLSRLTGRMFGALSRSRVGAATTAVITAVMLVVSSSGWIVFTAIDSVRNTGFSTTFSTVLRALPSSWGLVAVDAAARHAWGLTVLPLAGLVVLAAVLFVAWSRVLGPPRLGRPAVLGTAGQPARAGRFLGSATGSVYIKELRTWTRSPLRVQNLLVPPVFAVLSCLVPLAFGSSVFLPFAGALTALMGAATSANLYGQDGTALWLVLLTPGAEENDVRGRQLAWMALFGPLSVVLALLGTVLSGHTELWPWAAAGTAGVLGAGAGLVPLVGVTQLAPGPDPHRSRYSPMDHGDATGGAFAVLVGALALTVPALVPVIVGTVLDNAEVKAAGVFVGVVTGMTYWSLCARAARRRLVAKGPELLALMRAGKELPGQSVEGTSALKTMSKGRQRLLWWSFGIGCIALFPQALVPMAMKLSGHVAKVWFLALYVPGPWQWPTIAFMVLVAAVAFTIAARTFLGQRRRLRAPAPPVENGTETRESVVRAG
ncbi:hypothetical protein [Labedaea rhizosphaerae]|uniref:ABC-2 type transport system permease protein n=1 Tax=Labedaea rhizosphaerae TaxID=598644 RepID=A0A4R6S0X1_LABRH|nr:hypothetical protein [Labedaea rhizosphaerae]TDP92873.1 ABC-2 type transport system permease protein [Labedaea rhizosphaerae]